MSTRFIIHLERGNGRLLYFDVHEVQDEEGGVYVSDGFVDTKELIFALYNSEYAEYGQCFHIGDDFDYASARRDIIYFEKLEEYIANNVAILFVPDEPME